MTEFQLWVELPDGGQDRLSWPDTVPLPRWGEAFTYLGAVWHVSDIMWNYMQSRAGNLITYTITLGEDTE